MAERVWVGTDSGNEGDWSVAANWTGAAVPTNADDVFLGPGGTQAVIAGLNQSAITLNTLNVTDDWGGTAIGSADNYLQIQATTIVLNGAGRIFLDFGVTSTIPTVKVNNSAPNRDSMHIKGNCIMLLVTKGKLTYDSGAITDLVAQYSKSASGDVDVLLSTPTITAAYGLAGLIEMDGAGTITTLYLPQNGRALIREGTLTNAKVWGGLLDWRTNETMTRCDVWAGSLNGTQDQRAKTITNLYLWANGQANLAHGVGRITVSNTYEYGLNTVKMDP